MCTICPESGANEPRRSALAIANLGGFYLKAKAISGGEGVAQGHANVQDSFDILSEHAGDPALVGKQTGKDAGAGKATMVAILGPAGAKARLRELVGEAEAALAPFGAAAAVLVAAAKFVAERDT